MIDEIKFVATLVRRNPAWEKEDELKKRWGLRFPQTLKTLLYG